MGNKNELPKSAHHFYVDDLGLFIVNLEARQYVRGSLSEERRQRIFYSRTLSHAVTKFYSYYDDESHAAPVEIGVSYHLVQHGKTLRFLARKLKNLNTRYRQALPGHKTKREATERVRESRRLAIQDFLAHHRSLIECFKYQADNWLTEGSHSFNMEIASNPPELAICFEFVKALVDAFTPQGIVRARREPDIPRRQRDGWIKRYAAQHKKRGWSPREISREIQKELRTGTWNERSRLQYNLAPNTICRIAGLKLQSASSSGTVYSAVGVHRMAY